MGWRKYHLLVREQTDAINPGLARHGDNLRHRLELDIVVPSHKSYLFGAHFEDVVQARLQLVHRNYFLIDLVHRGMDVRPHPT
jgi:hypothetical protein